MPDVDVIAKVHSVQEGIEMVRKIRPNLVFLDVDMPEGSAFRVFEETTDVQYEKIILCGHSGHPFKAARYKVADYLVKPVCDNDYRVAVDRLLFSQGKMKIQQLYKDVFCKQKQLRLEKIFLKSYDHSRIVVDVDSILFIKGMGDLQVVVFTDGTNILVRKSMARLANALAFNGFFAVANHLLHLDRIQSIQELEDNMYVIMENGYQLPIPLSREHSLRQQLNLPGTGSAQNL
jgi:two-component system LytT family response regulator